MSYKINIGAGHAWQQEGWQNLDIAQGYDVRDKMLMGFPNESIDIIFTSHLIEHINYQNGFHLLKECYRTLKPDGFLHIIFPDIEKIAGVYFSTNDSMMKTWMGISGEQLFNSTNQGDHKSMYSVNFLKILLWQTGFRYIDEVKPFESSCQEINMIATLSNGMPVDGFINPVTIYISSNLDCKK
jgi:ubiquinone/menaquinone biosynthesis C-methylase UbiE